MTVVRTPPTLFEFISMEEHQVLVSLAKAREELGILAHLKVFIARPCHSRM